MVRMGDADTTGRQLARWLQEAGRRRTVRRAEACGPRETTSRPSVSVGGGDPGLRRPRFHRELLLLALAAVAFLPYLFADVQVRIYSLRSLIVFIFPGWQ